MAQLVPRPSPLSRPRAVAARLVVRAHGRSDRSGTVVPSTVADLATLVAAAQRLAQQHRDRHAVFMTPEAGQRLLRLEWAVHAGESVLARAARSGRLETGPALSPPRIWQVSR